MSKVLNLSTLTEYKFTKRLHNRNKTVELLQYCYRGRTGGHGRCSGGQDGGRQGPRKKKLSRKIFFLIDFVHESA